MSSTHRKQQESYQRFMVALREARIRSEMTQDQVATALGKSQDWVSRCETGEHPVNLVEAMEFAELYKISILDFVTAIQGKTPRKLDNTKLRDTPMLQQVELTSEMLQDGINYAYALLDTIDAQLTASNSGRLPTHIELANLSSIFGNFVAAGIANASSDLYEQNRPHAYPDLLRTIGTEQEKRDKGIEIKIALEKNKPKGHLPKAGYYITVRYVLASDQGDYTINQRGDVIWVWEIKIGFLKESDFAFSSTAGDSGKTAVISNQAFQSMDLIYFDPLFSPHKRLPYSIS